MREYFFKNWPSLSIQLGVIMLFAFAVGLSGSIQWKNTTGQVSIRDFWCCKPNGSMGNPPGCYRRGVRYVNGQETEDKSVRTICGFIGMYNFTSEEQCYDRNHPLTSCYQQCGNQRWEAGEECEKTDPSAPSCGIGKKCEMCECVFDSGPPSPPSPAPSAPPPPPPSCATAEDCNDGDACTDDICIQATGSCVFPDNGTCCNSDGECQSIDPSCNQCGSCNERVNCSCNAAPLPGAPRTCGLSPPPYSFTIDASCSSGCDPAGGDCNDPCEVCLLDSIDVPGTGCTFSCQPAPNAEILWPDQCGNGNSSNSVNSNSSSVSSSFSESESISSSDPYSSSFSANESASFSVSFSQSSFSSEISSISSSSSTSISASSYSSSSVSSSSPCPVYSSVSKSIVSSVLSSEFSSSLSSSSSSSSSICICYSSSSSSSSSLSSSVDSSVSSPTNQSSHSIDPCVIPSSSSYSEETYSSAKKPEVEGENERPECECDDNRESSSIPTFSTSSTTSSTSSSSSSSISYPYSYSSSSSSENDDTSDNDGGDDRFSSFGFSSEQSSSSSYPECDICPACTACRRCGIGLGNLCDEQECNGLGICTFTNGLFTNTCSPDPGICDVCNY